MLLKKLKITNFCGFASLEVEFGPGMNIIAGLNGAGKTSLLKAILECAILFFVALFYDARAAGCSTDMRQI